MAREAAQDILNRLEKFVSTPRNASSTYAFGLPQSFRPGVLSGAEVTRAQALYHQVYLAGGGAAPPLRKIQRLR